MSHAAGLYYEWHGPEEGEVLILSAGLGGAGAYWAPNLPALSTRYRVLIYDHRGTGRSDPELPEDLTIRSMAQDVWDLAGALGVRRAHFVGHAIGGLIAVELAIGGGRGFYVDKCIVVNGWEKLHPHTARCFDVRLELLRKSGPEAYVKAQPIFLYPASWIADHGAELEAQAAHQLAFFPPIETIEKRIAAARAWELWLDITGPILVIGAEDDMLVPIQCTRELAHALAIGELATMPTGGHACNITEPEAFNRIVLDFLGS